MRWKLTTQSLVRESYGLVKPCIVPRNYFPSAEKIAKTFDRMKFIETNRFTMKLKYHEIIFLVSGGRYRNIEIRPITGEDVPDGNNFVEVEDKRDCMGKPFRLIRTTGFKAPNYLGELKRIDNGNQYHVLWNSLMFLSADYMDLRHFDASELERCFNFSGGYASNGRLCKLWLSHDTYRRFTSSAYNGQMDLIKKLFLPEGSKEWREYRKRV